MRYKNETQMRNMQEDLQTYKGLAEVLLQQMQTGESQVKGSMKKPPKSVKAEKDFQELLERILKERMEKKMREIREYLRKHPEAA